MSSELPTRKRPRACDYCRKKKARCNRSEGSREPCSHCLAASTPCTFLSISRRRGSTKAYAAKLENRVQQMQRLLEKYASKDELEQSLGFPIQHDDAEDDDDVAEADDDAEPMNTSATAVLAFQAPPPPLSPHLPLHSPPHSPPHPHPILQTPQITLTMTMTKNVSPKTLVTASMENQVVALKMKQVYSGNVFKPSAPSAVFDDNWPEEFLQQPKDNDYCSFIPPHPIVEMLFDIFSSRVLPMYPLLNWRVFANQYADGLHERDPEFARLLLMVCAVASTYSGDRRVYQNVRGIPVPGYEYYHKSQTFVEPWSSLTLMSLQLRLLTSLYLYGVGDIAAAWVQSAAAIRVAEDFGAHRKKSCPNEQWKRVVWCLVVIDRQLSTALGRTPSIQEEDFDIEMPIVLPEDGEAAQDIESFSFLIRLTTIGNTAMRTMYTVRPSVVSFFGPDWEKRVVTDLDSALKTWLSSFPKHLRWDPDHMSPIHLEQSALMHCRYLHLMMMLHQGLIFPQHTVGPVESEANICVNAAKSSIRLLSAVQRRCGVVSMTGLFFTFVDALIILIHIWSLGEANPLADVTGLRSEVQQCIWLLRSAKGRCQMAVDHFLECLLDLSEINGDATPPDPAMDDIFGQLDFMLPVSYEEEDNNPLYRDLDDYLGLSLKPALPTPTFFVDSLMTDSAYFDLPSLSPQSPAESWKDLSSGDTASDYSHSIDTPKTPEDTSPPLADIVQDTIFRTWYSTQANVGWDVFEKFLANVNVSVTSDKNDSPYDQSVFDYLLTSSHHPDSYPLMHQMPLFSGVRA
ncbi:hypothetical protein BS47DRAFT_1485002 [Hydnum rufescens UP504]|uniref:Zn(2)-C6 fungal-type domain-containing protein n=1 Tax=Hydnum rufescens UP504 TaxID=1448309 RepID=A0A9P6AZ00_9AGAM|nr:hypothetical protein BS47DRAFT_1485002 [Hydnum rufescens UP504]